MAGDHDDYLDGFCVLPQVPELGILLGPAGVPSGRADNAGEAPEHRLRPPEAPHRKDGDFKRRPLLLAGDNPTLDPNGEREPHH